MDTIDYGLNKHRVNAILKEAEEQKQLHHPGSDYSAGITFVINLIRSQAGDERYERRSSIGDDSYF